MDFFNQFEAASFKRWDNASPSPSQPYYTLVESEEQMKLFNERLE